MTNERRHNRTDVRPRALELFLEGVRERHQADALALTTSDGLLIGGAGAPLDELEELGALGAARRPDWNGERLHVREVRLDGERLSLTSVGGAARGVEVDGGIQRILG